MCIIPSPWIRNETQRKSWEDLVGKVLVPLPRQRVQTDADVPPWPCGSVPWPPGFIGRGGKARLWTERWWLQRCCRWDVSQLSVAFGRSDAWTPPPHHGTQRTHKHDSSASYSLLITQPSKQTAKTIILPLHCFTPGGWLINNHCL